MKHFLDNRFDEFDSLYEDDDLDFERRKELALLAFKELINRESGEVVAPDTTGADFFFLRGFLTDELASDFAIIEQDFLKNCRAKLQEFNKVGWYGEVSFRTTDPKMALYHNILRLIYNGALTVDVS